jgi:epoxide hydrolase
MQLMTEVLGYAHFGAHGGDIGAMVANRLALEHLERLVGIHITRTAEPYVGPGAAPLTKAEQALLAARARWHEAEAATRTCSGPSRRPWPTGWPTRRLGWPPGS